MTPHTPLRHHMSATAHPASSESAEEHRKVSGTQRKVTLQNSSDSGSDSSRSHNVSTASSINDVSPGPRGANGKRGETNPTAAEADKGRRTLLWIENIPQCFRLRTEAPEGTKMDAQFSPCGVTERVRIGQAGEMMGMLRRNTLADQACDELAVLGLC
eukprot:3940604-Rhodomonas_salina.1